MGLKFFGLNSPGLNMQLFATRGYFVFAPNFKGARLSMKDHLNCVMSGIDNLIRTEMIDPDRLGVIGHSDGGFMTMSLICQSPRFKAAVCRAGYADLVGEYLMLRSDGLARTTVKTPTDQNGFGWLGGFPWQAPSRFHQNSPLYYLAEVTTPLMIIHGSADGAVPIQMADQIFVALRLIKKEVTYARYDNEEHKEDYWSFPNQVDFAGRVLDWFDSRLKMTK
jgi:dipeptidyl aminopeptidase/acylaminoacyl peptidase